MLNYNKVFITTLLINVLGHCLMPAIDGPYLLSITVPVGRDGHSRKLPMNPIGDAI